MQVPNHENIRETNMEYGISKYAAVPAAIRDTLYDIMENLSFLRSLSSTLIGEQESSGAFHKSYDYRGNGIRLFEQIPPLASLGRNDGIVAGLAKRGTSLLTLDSRSPIRVEDKLRGNDKLAGMTS